MTEHTDDKGKKVYHFKEEELDVFVEKLFTKMKENSQFSGSKFWSAFQKVIVSILTVCLIGIGTFIFAAGKTLSLHDQRLTVLECLTKDINMQLESLPTIETKVDLLVKGQIKNQ